MSRVAIAVHVYYEDTWPDIASALKHVNAPFDLIATVPLADQSFGLVGAISALFPRVVVWPLQNRGRDVRPFLLLLEKGAFDRYDYICKIHGKKSSDGGRSSHLGTIWRRRLLCDLLAAPNIVETIVERFDDDPRIGMIGPKAFRMPSSTYPEDMCKTIRWDEMLDLADRMGIPKEEFRLDFFGGSMFWVRRKALEPLRKLNLVDKFDDEAGLQDGGMEHIVERLFGTSVLAAGCAIRDTP